MNLDSISFYLNLSAGFSFLTMGLEAAGFLLCLTYRHLSGWTVLVAAGFAGLLSAGLISRLLSMSVLNPIIGESFRGPIILATGAAYFLSMIAVVGGLGMTFREFQHRLAIAMEPKDGWR